MSESVSGNSIRVCQFVGNMVGGGVEAVVMTLYRHIDRSCMQFDFVVTDASSVVPRDEVESLGGSVYTVPTYTRLPDFKRTSYELFRAHPEWRIVHAHMNSLSVFPLHQAERAGVPVRIAHSHSASGRGEFLRNTAKNILRTQANRYPTLRMACTEHAGRWLFGKAPFEVLPNPIDFSRFTFNSRAREEMRAAWSVPENALVIGHVGRWSPPKNQIFLLRVLKELLEAGTDAWLALVGDGPDRPAIEAGCLGVDGRVVAPGYMDAARAYSAFDIFCFPSRYEGLGMAPMEAQAAGLPCVVSDAVPTEVDLTAHVRFLPLGDAQAWADAVMDMAERVADRRVDLAAKPFRKHGADEIAARLCKRYLQLDEGVA